MTDTPRERAGVVRRWAEGLGFSLLGVTGARRSDHGGYVERWLADGKHGQMGYLAEHVSVRLDPCELLPGAASIICVADRYPPPPEVTLEDQGPSNIAGKTPATSGMKGALPEILPGAGVPGGVARYAWGEDYHKTIKKRLHTLADALRDRYPGHVFRAAVDTAPILEREHAQRAGLGWVGKHTLLINPRLGSWLLLGQIVTTLAIQADEPVTDHCGSCTRCIDACPTGCIEPYQLDASRCVSYLTIEHRGVIDPDLHAGMGDWIAGCDVCQEVCPFNQPGCVKRMAGGGSDRTATDSTEFRSDFGGSGGSGGGGGGWTLLEVLGWDADARRVAFKGSTLKRIKLDMIRRNALIAAGNHLRTRSDPGLRRRIEQIAGDPGEPEVVRTTARQVLSGPETRKGRDG